MKTNYSIKTVVFFLIVTIFTVQLQAQIIADGDYLLINAVNNEAMTAPDTFADGMPNPDFFAYMTGIDAADDNQLFTFTHLGNDIYTIVNKGSGNYLGIKDSWCGNFGNVQGRFQQTDTNINFKVVAAGAPDTYTIEIAFTECGFDSVNDPIKAFDIDGGNIGARINTFPKDPTNSNQQWQIVSQNILNVQSFDSKKDSAFLVSPIPADQYLDIVFAQSLGTDLTVGISTINGQRIMQKNIQNGQLVSRLDFSDMIPGLYFMSVTDKNERILANRKVMIK